MHPHISVLTLGVDDLERAVAFYRDGLGLQTEGIVGSEFEHGAVAFFDLQSGIKLALWPRASLAHDAGVPAAAPGPTELSLGHNVGSRADVDAVMERARRAGARIVKPAQDTFWGGYAGYFQDPDQHLWEVAWNPQWLLPAADTFALRPIGVVRSALTTREAAPKQGREGAPAAWIDIAPGVVDGLDRLAVGQEIILITWFHQALRDVLKVHPRDDQHAPLTGVFATRSPDRPNPLGLHRVTILELLEGSLKVEPLEAIDGTPIVDIKPVLRAVADA